MSFVQSLFLLEFLGQQLEQLDWYDYDVDYRSNSTERIMNPNPSK